MTIETDFSVGDKVVVLNKERIIGGEVENIVINVIANGTVKQEYWIRFDNGSWDKIQARCVGSSKEHLMSRL